MSSSAVERGWEKIRKDYWGLREVEVVTREMRLYAVRKNPRVLSIIAAADQDEDICAAALEIDGEAYQWVRVMSPKLDQLAVAQNGEALRWIASEKRTRELCWEAVGQTGLALQYVPENLRTHELCMAAVQKTGRAVQFVPNQTLDLCLAAVRQNGRALYVIKNKTPEVCTAAVQQNAWALRWVKEPRPDLCLLALHGGYGEMKK